MDVIELKAINANMFNENCCQLAGADGKSNARKEAYCELDIVTNYKFAKQKTREEKKKRVKENDELYQKIAELAARNDQLRQLKIETNSGLKAENSDTTSQEMNKTITERRRHHSKDGQGLGTRERYLVDKMGKKIEFAFTPKDKSKEKDSNKGDRPQRDGSRRERSKRRSSHDDKEREVSLKANGTAEATPDVGQTVNFLTNSIPLGPIANPKQVITVYENKNLNYETDSFLSNTTVRKLSLRSPPRARKPTIIEVNSKPVKEAFNQSEEDNFQPQKVRRNRVRPRSTKTSSKPDACTEGVQISDKCIGISPRKELSFSNLNLMPAVTDYGALSLATNVQMSMTRIKTPLFDRRVTVARKDDLTTKPYSPRADTELREMLRLKGLDLGSGYSKPYSMDHHKDKEVEDALSIIPQQDCTKSFKTTFAKNSRFRKRKQGYPSEAIVEISSKIADDHKKDKLGKSRIGSFTMQIFPGVSLTQTNVEKSIAGELRKVDKLASLKACTIIGQEIASKVACETCSSLALNTPSDSGIAPSKDEIKSTNTPQTSSDLSYRSRRRFWPSREFMRRGSSKNSKHKVGEAKRKPRMKGSKSKQTATKEQISQTLVLEAAVQTMPTCVSSSANIGVMAQVTDRQFYKCEAQTQYCRETEMYMPETNMMISKRDAGPKELMRRESDITHIEKLLNCQNYDIYNVGETSSCIPVRIKEKPTVKNIRVEEQKRIRKVDAKSVRKYSRSCSPESRNSSKIISPRRSTGSIPPEAVIPRKTKLKNSSPKQSSLVEKVNFHMETIMHHNEKIATLQNCLTEILQHLAFVQTSALDVDNVRSEKCETDVSSNTNSIGKAVSSEVPMRKFHRAKAYGEKLKQRTKDTLKLRKQTSPTKRYDSKEKHNLCEYRYSYGTHFVPMVNVKSVYKNPKGFVSSASSFSSKISELHPSSGSLSTDSCVHPPIVRRRRIIKKKDALHNNNQVKYSKKKSQSIFDMLRAYINVSSSSSDQGSTHLKALNESFSKIVVLSVSSFKFKSSALKHMKHRAPRGANLAKEKQPFFMSSMFTHQDITSTDSLEVEKTVDLCPLTAIFNMQPPAYAYHDYNAEIILNNPSKVNTIMQQLSSSTSGIFLSSNTEATRPSISLESESSREGQTEENLGDLRQAVNTGTEAYPNKNKINMTSFHQACKDRNPVILNYIKKNENATSLNETLVYNTYSLKTKQADSIEVEHDDNSSQMSSTQILRSNRKTNSFKNFFRRRTLLDIFKSKHPKMPAEPKAMKSSSATSSPAVQQELVSSPAASKTVLWFNFMKKKRDSSAMCDPWCRSISMKEDQKTIPESCKSMCHSPLKSRDYAHMGTFSQDTHEKHPRYTKPEKKDATGWYRNEMKGRMNDTTSRPCSCNEVKGTREYEESYSHNKHMQDLLQQRSRSMSNEVDVVSVGGGSSDSLLVAEYAPCSRTQTTDHRERVRSPGELEQRPLSDREVFETLLRSYERRDTIAMRLSRDERFFCEQIQMVNVPNLPDMQVRNGSFADRPSTSENAVQPDDIGTCFARGFRPDNLLLSGDACFHVNQQDKMKLTPHMLSSVESTIDFSERETPLEFLLALGFMVDEASNALKDDNVRSRLQAAITEARVWINKITTTQGTLLYLVSYKARPETMRYFLQLVEAIINRRIKNAIQLDGFLRVLEDVEAGKLQMINILGEEKFEDEENEEKIVMKQLKNLFVTVFNIAEKEASACGRKLLDSQVNLLRILVAKYRAGLHPHLDLIARYIGQGLLHTEVQLEAAMIFLSRLDTADVKLKEFENYCGISCQLQDI